MISRAELERQAKERAYGRCEYCRMDESLQGARFHLEHVIPLSRRGRTHLANLAWACPSCNLRKSDRVEATDPDTGIDAPLFHPRLQVWHEHFVWEDHQVVGLTGTASCNRGCAGLNESRKTHIRQAEQAFGLFPSET